MNDSGFWIFAKMGGLSELDTLKTWTPLLVLLGVVSMAMTVVLAVLLPMAPV
jgi:H+/gluconate symporter-like permease